MGHGRSALEEAKKRAASGSSATAIAVGDDEMNMASHAEVLETSRDSAQVFTGLVKRIITDLPPSFQ